MEAAEDAEGLHLVFCFERSDYGGEGEFGDGFAREFKVGASAEAGAGSVFFPLVMEQAGVGVEVFELGGVFEAGLVGAVGGVGAVGILGPEAVEDEAAFFAALARVWVGGAELGFPAHVEDVVVEFCGWSGDRSGLVAGFLSCGGLRGVAVAAGEGYEAEEQEG